MTFKRRLTSYLLNTQFCCSFSLLFNVLWGRPTHVKVLQFCCPFFTIFLQRASRSYSSTRPTEIPSKVYKWGWTGKLNSDISPPAVEASSRAKTYQGTVEPRSDLLAIYNGRRFESLLHQTRQNRVIDAWIGEAGFSSSSSSSQLAGYLNISLHRWRAPTSASVNRNYTQMTSWPR